MKYFTIDAETNNITVHSNRQAARDTGAGVFASEVQLADLIGPNNQRLIEIWNSLPGVTPVKKFSNRKIATERIWRAVQNLGETTIAEPAQQEQQATPATPFDEPVANAGAQGADVAPVKPKASKKASPAKKAPKGERKAKPTEKATSDRTNRKAEVIAMMKRAKGATLPEIMVATGWQKHTVRGFVSILGSKGGENIESFKNATNERTYRIAK